MKPAITYFRVGAERQGRSRFGLAESATLLMWFIGIALPFALALQEAAISVPCVDDYSFAGVAATHGLPAAIHNEYLGWSGRFLSYTIEFSLTYFIWISWA
ncbi:MAG: hypothetical protein JO270_24650, partial [Acidobacteriaceae bacterium]|nr:hypothetical protein [Acidobacteriaceae bacterium]